MFFSLFFSSQCKACWICDHEHKVYDNINLRVRVFVCVCVSPRLDQNLCETLWKRQQGSVTPLQD